MSGIEKLCLTSQSTQNPSSAEQSAWEEAFSRSRSNCFPNSAVERSQLCALIEEIHSHLRETELQDARRIQLAKKLELQESLLSPIRRLPPEILSEILKLVTPDTIIVQRGFRSRAGDSIFPLTWVSFWWRETIVSQPSFWSCLELRSPEPVLGSIIPILRVCLARSGTAPICLHLHFHQTELTPWLCNVLDDLAQHADRWRELKSTVDLPGLTYILKQAHNLTENPFSILDTMKIFCPFKICAEGILGNSFVHCPRLHNLQISHLRATDIIDLTHLSMLDVIFYKGCSFAVLLEKCPVLETLIVGYINKSLEGWETTSIPTVPRVCHAHLQTLVLIINKNVVAGAWQSVQLPNLTDLRVQYAGTLNITTFE
ncbi:hypothetical protein BT96DRAFT_1018033 [Gymnopus androsaceus JB14]|uniref:F-box domain-containing protein n=1 Tax=Gymnopus androsaceus JB14 TaxID=1447944 RepID=A0A6A4HRK7_9AGAR|nr:hypothetical protein BT96DRAFT_1018033 [Gymnopus androsaceus JB14]